MDSKKYNRKEFLKKIGNYSLGSLGLWLGIPQDVLSKKASTKSAISEEIRQRVNTFKKGSYRLFDSDWKFTKGDIPGAEQADFDTSNWRNVELPHDWSIEDLSDKDELPSISISDGKWKFMAGDNTEWKNTFIDDESWQKVTLPDYWDKYSKPDKTGSYGWYRREIEIPANLINNDFLLNIGRIADSDETYFNGVRIGGSGEFPPDYKYSYYRLTPANVRVYRVPAHLVRRDRNVVSVRVYCHNENGGIYASAPTPRVIGPFSPKSPGGGSTGHTIGGIGWYRKEFTLNQSDKNKRVSILFDGVYMNSDTWINGHYLGKHPYGYTSYGYDLTPYLRSAGQPNVISIRVDNTGSNSRWYSGSGIYRHVKIKVSEPVHFQQWGLYVTTPKVTQKEAMVEIESTIKNDSDNEKTLEIESVLYDSRGGKIGHEKSQIAIRNNGEAKKTHLIKVNSPGLWSPDNPTLYNARVNLYENGVKIDQLESHVGIRSVEVDAEHGLRINGMPVNLKGGCMHHCNGPLGSKAIDRAEERRVELMKEHGYNAIRTSHNPPSPAFLDACDRLGMLVMDEAFDCWDKGKTPMDYHLYFKKWWRKDIESMIKRDRNHPSVILWSIGNEIPDRAEPTGFRYEEELVSLVHQLDSTRPVTEAINGVHPWSDTSTAFELLDVGGYNYLWENYTIDHKTFPKRVMVGTESFPKAAFENWKQVEEHPWVIGDFVWTGMDYLGESGLGHALVVSEHTQPKSFEMPWPWHISNCGDIDICGFKKPQSYYRDVVWKQSMLEMAVHSPIPKGHKERVSKWGWPDEDQSWTWPVPKGEILSVNVYTRYPVVRLELNGKVIGEKKVTEATKLTATFEVPYEPGELKVSGIKNGHVVEHKVLKTVGKAKAIRLEADRAKIHANRNDLSYVTVEVVDAQGQRIPNSETTVYFEVSGDGELAAVGNGNPRDMKSFSSPHCKTFKGRCLAILRPKGDKSGRVKLRARSEGLAAATINVEVI